MKLPLMWLPALSRACRPHRDHKNATTAPHICCNRAADQSRVIIDARVAGDSDVGEELRRRSTIFGLVLLAMRTPAKFMLPPWLLAYTLRTALNITDLVVNKYRSQLQLPKFVDFSVQQVGCSTWFERRDF